MASLAKLRYVRVVGFALAGVAVAGAAVLVTASAAGLNVGFRPAATQHPDQVATASVSRQASTSAVFRRPAGVRARRRAPTCSSWSPPPLT